MNRKMVNSITLVLAFSATAAFAAETVQDTAASVSTISSEEIESQPEGPSILERLAALEKSAKKSDWTQKVKFKGDLRYRFEWVEEENSTTKNRQRIRARIGAYAEVNDFTAAGIRIRTGEAANSGNETIGSDFDSKDIYFDLGYMTLAPEGGKYGAVTLGKMKYPWKVTTDMIWDGDVNPEGGAYTYSTKVEDTGLFGSAGYFKLDDDDSTHDLNLGSVQAGVSQPLSENSKLTVGGSFFYYDNATDFPDPDTDGVLNYPVDYSIAEAFGELSFKDVLPIPFKLYGNVVNNTEESSSDEGYCGGIKFGDAKKGKWEAKVGYRRLERNAAPAYYADSDFAGGGTGVKGTRLKAKYNIAKHLQFGLTYIAGEEISSSDDVNTLHLDLIASF